MAARPPEPEAVCWSWYQARDDGIFPKEMTAPRSGWYRVDGGELAAMFDSAARRLIVSWRWNPAARFEVTERPANGQRCPVPDA